ncbi:MAG: hypothetical protein C0599_14740 [Salinivirgaceae bacterium]|nr:MAG: hypothetical protein C0599_14740 [Salinivirgaceae bacterium]
MIKIITIDDHTLFAQGLCKIISDHFTDTEVRYFNSIKNFQKSDIQNSEIDLIISDIELPEEDVFTFFQTITDIPILVISMHNKLHVIKKCMELGVKGYILKDDHDKVETAIHKVLTGETYYSPKVKNKLNISDLEEKIITPKEREIIKLVVEGKNNQEIADNLFLSINTIKTHRKNINSKLQLNSTAELIKYFHDNCI